MTHVGAVRLSIVLIGLLITPSVYGTITPGQMASYKWGFISGKNEWGGCSDSSGNGDCATGLTDCSNPQYTIYNYTTGYYNSVPNHAPLSNMTACIDGWVNGWNHVCDKKVAESWPNRELICPITVGRAVMNATIPGSANATGNPNQIIATIPGSANATGQIIVPWSVDARILWQNTTDNGIPIRK